MGAARNSNQPLACLLVQAVNELPPEAKRARLQQLQMMSTVHKGIASAEYPSECRAACQRASAPPCTHLHGAARRPFPFVHADTNDQFGDGTGRVANPYRHEYQGWDVYQQKQQQRG